MLYVFVTIFLCFLMVTSHLFMLFMVTSHLFMLFMVTSHLFMLSYGYFTSFYAFLWLLNIFLCFFYGYLTSLYALCFCNKYLMLFQIFMLSYVIANW